MARSRSPRASRAFVAPLAALAVLGGVLASPPPATAARSCGQVDQDGPCGMNLTAAWERYTTGDPGVVIAYVEAGINWRDPSAASLVDSIYVNWRETPVPCASPCDPAYSPDPHPYDVDGNGRINAADWKDDPRVTDANGNGFIDPEDLIVAFSTGADRDHNGYPSDISGWDFYDGQNDPATYDSAYGHANSQMGRLHHMCPQCSILPVKAGAEALDRSNDLAQAWLYAADAGASVIASTTADLGYSSFMAEAVQYLADRGIVMVESSNDFDSADHQGGMFHPNVIPGNGAVPTADGTRWVRSNYTSWGSHNLFTAATTGGTTSESTPTLAGVFGLLLSYGRLAAREGLIDHPLTGGEALQVMRQTSRRIQDGSLPWPGRPGEWNLQYGYGMPNLARAMHVVSKDAVPPDTRIDSPEWYTLFDPTRQSSVPVTGTIQAPRSSGFSWNLQAATGPQPRDADWFTIGAGTGHGSFHGTLGTLDLSTISKRFWSRAFHLSKKKSLPTVEQYTVTLRLVVTDADARISEDRRAINVVHDPSWLTGFPLRLHSGGESQPALADLQRTGHPAIVMGDSDGFVHAIDPVTRAELTGWPVHTLPNAVRRQHPGVHPGYEPILADVAVGNLDGSGLSVVAATTSGRVYVFDAHGHLRPGWPQVLNTDVHQPAIPRPDLPYTRLPVQGLAAGGPVLFDMDGDHALEVIAAGWDGFLHVWKAGGSNLAGWPVKVKLPDGYQPPPNYVLVNDKKLDTPPAVAFLQGRAAGPFLVVRSQFTETRGSGIQPAPFGYVFAYGADGSPVQGWPARLAGTVEYYGSAQEFVTEGSSAPVAVDLTGTGQGPDSIVVAPVLSPFMLIGPTGQVITTYQGANDDPPISFTTSASFGKVGGVLSMVAPQTGSTTLAAALLQPNNGLAIKDYETVFPPGGGPARPGFPVSRQGIDFLGQAVVADVTGDGMGEVIDGGDSNAMHAWDMVGQQAQGFPKWTTGWNVFAPVVGDLKGDGTVDVVTAAREGWLFVWQTPGLASANTEWWRGQHDDWNSGNYGVTPG